MQTRLVDVHDDAACRRAYDVLVAGRSVERPWHQPPSLEETLIAWRHVDAAEPMEMWAAVDDGQQVVGVATLWLPQTDNTTQLWCEVVVDPDHRRRGAGGALAARLVERAVAEHRTTLITEFPVPVNADDEHPHRRFAVRHGFTLGSTEISRHLRLPVADDILDGLMEKATPAFAGDYRLETHVDGVPEPLRESLCGVMNLLGVDAPTGEIDFEPETLDPARYAEYLEVEARQHRTRLTTVAVHEETGSVVGYSDLVLPAGAPTRVWQWGPWSRRVTAGTGSAPRSRWRTSVASSVTTRDASSSSRRTTRRTPTWSTSTSPSGSRSWS
ncbi:MAG: GNAT family N-acetyltransferase [Lapillicoccus sp.]